MLIQIPQEIPAHLNRVVNQVGAPTLDPDPGKAMAGCKAVSRG